MATVLKVESVVEFATLFKALANLATDAVARLHNPLATCRCPAIQAIYYMLHAVLFVKLARNADLEIAEK